MVKSVAVIQKLVDGGVIPEFGEFDITDVVIDHYQNVYKSLYERVGSEFVS